MVCTDGDRWCYNKCVSEMEQRRFQQLAEQLRELIGRGEYPVGNLLPAERQLQERFGVSRTTVRRALAELVSMGWAESSPKRGVIAKLGWIKPRSTRVAYIDHGDYVHRSLFFQLHTQLNSVGLDLVHVDSQDLGTMGALRRAVDEGFSAAFVWPKVALVDPDELADLQTRLPVISVDHSIGGEPSDLVMSDHSQGARLLVSHLLRLGRKRIAITGNFTNLEDAQLRFAGYMTGLYEHGVSPEACDFVFSSPQREAYEDPRLLQFRLSQEDRPDAIFVLHDMSVPPTVEAVLESGLTVPGDVAVVGFGNDLPFNVDGLGLTTIAMNWGHVAKTLCCRLKERLDNPAAPYRRLLIKTHLVIRGSCGAPPETWSSEPYEISSVTVTRRMQPSPRLFNQQEAALFQTQSEPQPSEGLTL